MLKKNFTAIFILGVVVVSSFIFGFGRIRHFTGGDESLWSYGRVPGFWNAVATHNWKKTKISDKPGITVALISGLGLPFIPDPRPYESLIYASKTPEQLKEIENIYFFLRLPILIFSLASLAVFFLFIKKLLNERVALLATVLIGLSPILVGMSIYINSDSLLWIFLPLTILSFLIYQKFSNQKYLVLSGGFLGLSLLTKYVAVILFPFLLALIFLRYIFSSSDNAGALKYFKKAFGDYLILLIISVAVIFLLFPATWLKPKLVLDATLGSRPFLKILPVFLGVILVAIFDIFVFKSFFASKLSDFLLKYKLILVKLVCFVAVGLIFFTIVNTYVGMKMLNFPQVLSDPRVDPALTEVIKEKIPKNIATGFYSLIFGLTPVTLVSFIFTLLTILKAGKEKMFSKKDDSLLVAAYLIFFVLVFYVAASLLGVSSMVRYQVSLYPIALIIAAIGLSQMLEFEKVKKYFARRGFQGLIFLLIVVSSWSLYLIKPFYLEYSSIFLPQKYLLNADNSCDTSWEVSQYLNNLPDAQNLYIWTDSRQVCEKFVGRCAFGLRDWISSEVNFDYFVVPLAEQSSQLACKNNSNAIKIGASLLDTTDLYAQDKNYDFKISIDGREVTTIKVIKNNKK